MGRGDGFSHWLHIERREEMDVAYEVVHQSSASDAPKDFAYDVANPPSTLRAANTVRMWPARSPRDFIG